jgi:hypothetical protein
MFVLYKDEYGTMSIIAVIAVKTVNQLGNPTTIVLQSIP